MITNILGHDVQPSRINHIGIVKHHSVKNMGSPTTLQQPRSQFDSPLQRPPAINQNGIDIEDYLSTTMSAAGVPIFEIIRNMEEENILTKEDRLALHLGLNDPGRRDGLIKAFQDVELSQYSKFALKRLKGLIHQNGTGEPTGNFATIVLNADYQKQQSSKITQRRNNADITALSDTNSIADDSYSSETVVDTLSNISKVVGNDPSYGGISGPNICSKIKDNLMAFRLKHPNKSSRWGQRRFGVIVGSGSYNPLTRMHLRTFYVAKQFLERSTDYIILGSLLSPAHATVVRERYRTCPSEIMPSPHRLAVAQMAVEESKWIAVDPWEITRRRGMDYLSLLEHVAKLLRDNFDDADIRVIFLCKANMVPKLSPSVFRRCNFEIVCVCRAPESDTLVESLGARWKGLLHVAEDTAILDASMDMVSSRRVRDKLKANESVETLVGEAIANYFRAHRIGPKVPWRLPHAVPFPCTRNQSCISGVCLWQMAGAEEWEESEKQLPKMTNRPANPTSPRGPAGAVMKPAILPPLSVSSVSPSVEVSR